MTQELIEQKMQQLQKLSEEMKQLKDELVEAGAWPLDENDLDKAAGGVPFIAVEDSPVIPKSLL